MDQIRLWLQRYFSDPQVIVLTFSLLALFLLIVFFGGILAPVFGSIVLAYLLEGLVSKMERLHIPRLLGVTIVFLGLVMGLLFIFVWLLPLLSRQITQVFQQIPDLIEQGRAALLTLPDKYPEYFSEQQIEQFMSSIGDELVQWRQQVVSRTLSVGMGLLTVLVYLVLVPVLVFFLLKDKDKILGWLGSYLPRESGLAATVWRDVDVQVGNFVRGKFWEIIIVWAVSALTFVALGLDFAILLGALVGFSVLVPYIGAAVVTVPIAMVAYLQFGVSAELAYVVGAYAVIQFFDANILVPVMFSEVVNLHPVAIIVAVVFFGGIWGFWGVFFAIPLATVVQAVLKALPIYARSEQESTVASGADPGAQDRAPPPDGTPAGADR